MNKQEAMSETFDKLLENRDYWRDEAKASWATIEALEAENNELRWAKRQEDDQEAQDLEKYNQRFFDPDSLKSGLSVELEGTSSKEVFDLIMGKQPEQELREITMVAKIVDDQPAHEAARPPRRTRRRVRRYRR